MTAVVELSTFRSLAGGLREADGFAAIAAATLTAAIESFGYTSGIVEAHGADGMPVVCVATPDVQVSALRDYVGENYRHDRALATLRATHHPAIYVEAERGRSLLIGPLLGEGELIGAIRLSPAARDVQCLLEIGAICSHVSVRLAHVGYTPFGKRHILLLLTPRQRQVVRLVARGWSNAEISQDLAISANAVKKHLGLALRALDLTNRTELAALASRAIAELDPIEEDGRTEGGLVIVRGLRIQR